MALAQLAAQVGLVVGLAGLLWALWDLGRRFGPDETRLPGVGTVGLPPLVVYGGPLLVAAWVQVVGLAPISAAIAAGIQTFGPLVGIIVIGGAAWWYVERGEDDDQEVFPWR